MKPTFQKKYFGGEFSVLMKMLNVDRNEPAMRRKSWEKIQEVEPDGRCKQFRITGRAVVLN